MLKMLGRRPDGGGAACLYVRLCACVCLCACEKNNNLGRKTSAAHGKRGCLGFKITPSLAAGGWKHTHTHSNSPTHAQRKHNFRVHL